MRVRRNSGQARGRGGPGYGERTLFSLALILASLMWMGRDTAAWVTVLCVAGAIAGVVGAVFFGTRFVGERRGRSE